jgi:hypothetical protein
MFISLIIITMFKRRFEFLSHILIVVALLDQFFKFPLDSEQKE